MLPLGPRYVGKSTESLFLQQAHFANLHSNISPIIIRISKTTPKTIAEIALALRYESEIKKNTHLPVENFSIPVKLTVGICCVYFPVTHPICSCYLQSGLAAGAGIVARYFFCCARNISIWKIQACRVRS